MSAVTMLRRVLRVIAVPGSAWREIAADETAPDKIFLSYTMPLAALPALCAGIGQLLYGHVLPAAPGHVPERVAVGAVYALGYGVVGYLQLLAAVAVAALAIRALAPLFRLERVPGGAMKTSAYGATPYMLGGVFLLLPPMSAAQSIGTLAALLYGITEVVLGLRATLRAPLLRAIPLAVVALVVAFIASFVTLFVLGLALKPFLPA